MDTPGDNVENNLEHEGNNGEIIDPPGEGDNDANGPEKKHMRRAPPRVNRPKAPLVILPIVFRARITLGRRNPGEKRAIFLTKRQEEYRDGD